MLTNSARLIGRVGSEIDFKNDKITVANFSLATKEYFTKNEKSNEITDWHKIVAFDKTAENINKIVKKGDLIEVLGKIKSRSWDDKDGIKRSVTEIICFEFMLFPKSENKKDNITENNTSPPKNINRPMADDIPF
ncbi:single-stranded DNA-binding protein [Silvanigrella sp.]|jgi:single-strand DNA-binding protein|uniref:single-stranded DNA-binding protein n=1 Tax=Silvanigrella sp. TaxID=2024976 RepID=UPI0037C75A47